MSVHLPFVGPPSEIPSRVLDTVYEGVAAAGLRLGLHESRLANRDAVVMYHSVRDPADVREGTSDRTVAEFRRHLSYFDEEFEVVDLGALTTPAPDRKRVAITFDDGYRDFYTHALPVLREFDAPATVFVVTDFVGDADPEVQAANAGHVYEPLTHDQVAALADDPLVTVGNHTRTHHDLRAEQDRSVVESEVVGARDDLADRYGIDADRFCYPNGRYNRTSVDVVGTVHDLATTDESRRPFVGTEHPLLLPRIDGGLSLSQIAWRLSDLNGTLLHRVGAADPPSWARHDRPKTRDRQFSR